MALSATLRRTATHAPRLAKPRRRSELGLLVVGALVVLCATLLESLATTNALPEHAVQFIVSMAVVGVVVQGVNRRYVPNADPVIMPVALVLDGLGYVMIERIGPAAGLGDIAGNQFLWTAVGLFAYCVVVVGIKRSRDLERYRYLLLVAAIVLLVLPLAPVIGRSPANAYGAKLFITFHHYTFQPIEIAKLLLVIFFASYFVEKRELLTIPTRRVGNRLLPDLRAFGPIAVAGATALLIILGEHDIGFSLILFVVFLSMLWITTGRWTYLLVGLVLFAVATYAASHILIQVNERITNWLEPMSTYNQKGGGYQAVQGELAFGRGGLFGTGIGFGQAASVVPESQSDYVFSVIGEELGLIGTAAFVVAYVLIIGSGLRAAVRARSDFAQLAAVGFTATLGFQAFFIMAGTVRLLPLTGVTLPFVAAGGSSLVANFALLGLLMRISDEGNQPLPEAPTLA